MKVTNEMNMTEGNLFKKIITYALPFIFSGILQLLYNAADLIVCGQFGSVHASGAISATSALINLIIQLFLGLSVGSNVIMARCYGQKNKEKGQRVVYTSMIYSLVFGIVIGIFGFIFSKYFLIWMGTPDDIIDLSTIYLQIYFIGLPFSMIYNFGSSLFRAVGDTKRPFIFLSSAGIINVILNLIFVICFNMDVAGVALATIISEGISALLIVISLFKSKGFFEFKLKDLKFHRHEGAEIMKIGLPAGIQSTLFSVSNVLIQSSVNSLGTLVVDGNGASSSLEGFIYTSMNCIAQSAVSFVSANYGAKHKKNILKTMFYSMILIILANLLVGGVIGIFNEQLIRLYIQDDVAIKVAQERLLIISLTYFTCGFMDLFAYCLRGIGYSITPMIITLCGACGLRIVWILTFFQMEEFHNIQGLVVSYPISWIITALVQVIFFIIVYRRLKFKED